jgi:hypothetical protein
MSSIMDALRRLERERQDPREPPPFDLPAETGRRPRRPSRSLLRAALAGAILAGTAVGALWMLPAGKMAWRGEAPAIAPPSRDAGGEGAGEADGVRIAARPAVNEGGAAPLPSAAEPALAPTGPVPLDAGAGAPEPGSVPAADAGSVPTDAGPVPAEEGPEAREGEPADAAAALAGTPPDVPSVAGIPGAGDTGRNAVGDAQDQETLDRLQEQLRERRHAVMARRAAAAAAEKTAAAPRPWQRPLAAQAPAPLPSAATEIAALPAPEEPFADGGVPPEVAGEGADLAARPPDEAFPSLPEGDVPPPIETGVGADLPGGAAPLAETTPAGEPVARRPPRGAPRVHVSFLFYSEDPGRRRVMLTVNQSPDLITLYEGQTHEAFEVARILPAEVHLRYQGQLFAVGAGH